MSGAKNPVLHIPLPAMVGGGFCTIGIAQTQDRPGLVMLAITSRLYTGPLEIPGADAVAFANEIFEAADR